MRKKFAKLRIKNYFFSPKLLPCLVFFILFPLLISLGLWQIHRGKEKQLIQLQILKQRQATPIYLNQLATVAKEKIYTTVLAEGHFDNTHTFLLDNKVYQQQIGYEVLTPFIPKNSHAAILVNRGWIPQGQSRENLPLIKPIERNLTIEGLLIWPQKTFSFKTIVEKKWPQRIQTLTAKFLNQQQFKPFLIVLDKQHPYGFTPLWRPIILPASRHYAYACQWFALSLTLLIAFFTSQFARYDS
ncbi:MAG: SURF1 family protein [Pseudomonadota bacterium]